MTVLLFAGLIGAGISGVFNAISQAVSGQAWDWGSFGLSLAAGFVAGAISAIPLPGFLAGMVLGSILNVGVGEKKPQHLV